MASLAIMLENFLSVKLGCHMLGMPRRKSGEHSCLHLYLSDLEGCCLWRWGRQGSRKEGARNRRRMAGNIVSVLRKLRE